MKQVSAAVQTALEGRAVSVRDFVWLVVRDRTDGSPVNYGMWSGLGTISAQVVDPLTGATVARGFEGAGNLVAISPIPRVSNLTAPPVTIAVSQLANGNELIRTYDAKQAQVQIFRGLFMPGTDVQLDPAIARFVGFVDEITVTTPQEGEAGGINLTCISHAQELGRSSAAKRSDAYMRQRNANDNFRRHVAAVGNWDLKWGISS